MLEVLLAIALSGPGQASAASQAAAPVAHAVLFFSPTCPHCERVINDHLIPLQERYGAQLAIVALNTSTQYGYALFQAAMDHYGIPRQEWGVPFMIVGGEILAGGDEIPARFPGLIENALAAQGIDLPAFPELLAFLEQQGALVTLQPGPRYLYRDPAAAAAAEAAQATEEPEEPAATVERAAAHPDSVVEDSIAHDTALDADSAAPQAGPGPEPYVQRSSAATADAEESRESAAPPMPSSPDSLDEAGVAPPTHAELERPSARAPTLPVSLGDVPDPAADSPWARFARDRAGNSLALAVLAGMIVALARGVRLRRSTRVWPEWVTPVLVALGLGVAAYLSYVEITGDPAVCGPVGDCNTVQQSPYARLFGVVPVGVLGVVGYLVIMGLWWIRRRGDHGVRRLAALGVWLATLAGTLFSVYLTILEPFFIGATCMWCLTSAGVMALLLLASAPPAARALRPSERS